jgi:hypothetical protein
MRSSGISRLWPAAFPALLGAIIHSVDDSQDKSVCICTSSCAHVLEGNVQACDAACDPAYSLTVNNACQQDSNPQLRMMQARSPSYLRTE